MELLLVLIKMFGSAQYGTGYMFKAHGDKFNPRPYAACLHRDMDDERDAIVAHRTLPCRSKVIVFNLRNSKWTVATVGDRGPYGKYPDGTYKGVVDMSPIINRRIQAKGKAPVVLIPLGKKAPHGKRHKKRIVRQVLRGEG